MKNLPSIAVAQALAPAPTVPRDPALSSWLTSLYALTQHHDFVFGSPLGPFHRRGRPFFLPRFVYFGPDPRDEALRLAFLGSFDTADLRGALALARLVERLALEPAIGQGLNLTFFPIVDVLGAFSGEGSRQLDEAHWGFSRDPEILLLEKDARQQGYHGFVSISSTSQDSIVVRLRGGSGAFADSVQIVAPEDFETWPVRFENTPREENVGHGPLTIADDLRLAPFELNLALPVAWPQTRVDAAVAGILQRFIARHAAIQAFAQHL